MVNAYWWKANNLGDSLNPTILRWLGVPYRWTAADTPGKLLALGSNIHHIREGDTVWGTGTMGRPVRPVNARILATRGPLTRGCVGGPEVYGDPAILMPLIHRPNIERIDRTGVVPHYVDKCLVKAGPGELFIDIENPDWRITINQILSCKLIISSSLHGIVIAEAYGIPAVWMKYSDNVEGGDIKFQDYFLGSGRSEQPKGRVIPPILDLEARQQTLIQAIGAL